MWKPYIPFYIPCRQATHEEKKALETYLLRELKANAELSEQNNSYFEPEQEDAIMLYEFGSYEVLSLTNNSIIVVFDWLNYQTSCLVPHQDESKQKFPKVMCVFWKGNPNSAELFIWEHDGSFHRLVNHYHPEKLLRDCKWHEESHVL